MCYDFLLLSVSRDALLILSSVCVCFPVYGSYTVYEFIDNVLKIKMNERNGRHLYHSRVSPSPGKGATPAYTLCPLNDPDLLMPGSSVLSIPLSAITLPTKNGPKDGTGLYQTNTKVSSSFLFFPCFFCFCLWNATFSVYNLDNPISYISFHCKISVYLHLDLEASLHFGTWSMGSFKKFKIPLPISESRRQIWPDGVIPMAEPSLNPEIVRVFFPHCPEISKPMLHSKYTELQIP